MRPRPWWPTRAAQVQADCTLPPIHPHYPKNPTLAMSFPRGQQQEATVGHLTGRGKGGNSAITPDGKMQGVLVAIPTSTLLKTTKTYLIK